MDLSGKYEIQVGATAVWEALNDPQILTACVPGCDNLQKTSPTDFVAAATVKIGPMKATFKGKISLSELDPPRRCIVRGEGQGGAAGFAKGEAEVLLAESGGVTVLTYTAKATVGGKLAQIGQRLIDGAAKQIADEFFGRFAEILTQRNAASPPATHAPATSQAGRLPMKPWIMAVIVALAVAVVLLFAL